MEMVAHAVALMTFIGCCLFYSGDNSRLGPRNNTHACRMVDSSSSSVKAVLDTTLNCPNTYSHCKNALNTKLHENKDRVKLDEPRP